MTYIFTNYHSMSLKLRQDMGFTIYFQQTKYQKNHFDTFSAMLYFVLTFIDSSFSHMVSNVKPRYVCGDIYMERLTYAQCQKFLPNAESTQEMDGKEKEGEKSEGRGGNVFDLFQRYYKLSECSCSISFTIGIFM